MEEPCCWGCHRRHVPTSPCPPPPALRCSPLWDNPARLLSQSQVTETCTGQKEEKAHLEALWNGDFYFFCTHTPPLLIILPLSGSRSSSNISGSWKDYLKWKWSHRPDKKGFTSTFISYKNESNATKKKKRKGVGGLIRKTKQQPTNKPSGWKHSVTIHAREMLGDVFWCFHLVLQLKSSKAPHVASSRAMHPLPCSCWDRALCLHARAWGSRMPLVCMCLWVGINACKLSPCGDNDLGTILYVQDSFSAQHLCVKLCTYFTFVFLAWILLSVVFSETCCCRLCSNW